MKDVITYVGIDAHKKDLFVAMLIGDSQTPVTWNRTSRMRFVVWCENSNAKRRGRSASATKPGRAAMRCNGR